MNLIQKLPDGPLDIIGDIHGEFDALTSLLRHLGYDLHGCHAEGRVLVFVGDFCDRGPDSPAVLQLIKHLVTSGRAFAILGNHEVNLLRKDVKDGSGWYFDERMEHDQAKYAPFARPGIAEKEEIFNFLSTLPIALERSDLRVIHAAWISEKINEVRSLTIESLLRNYDVWDKVAQYHAQGMKASMAEELSGWKYGLENPQKQPPFLHAHADHDSVHQMMNPIRILTSGVERKGNAPFFTGGKWRFAERVQWWNEYEDFIPVVIGHYWRRYNAIDRDVLGKGDPDLFDEVPSHSWHGKHGNVFCVDFSVGGRWVARKANEPVKVNFKLAALQWPERILRFDDGQVVLTSGFMA